MNCPNCGSTVPTGSRVCSVCNAYQPRLRRKAYIVIILMVAWISFELSPLASGFLPLPYVILSAVAVAAILMVVVEVLGKRP